MTRPRKMTPTESSWVRRLRKVLADCPDTLELLTDGGWYVSVIDRALADGDLHDGRAETRGAVLAYLRANCRTHGVAS